MIQAVNIDLLFNIFVLYFIGLNGMIDDGATYNNCLTWDDNEKALTLICRMPKLSTFVKFSHQNSKTNITCSFTGSKISCDPSDTDLRYFHKNNQTIAVLQKLKNNVNLNGAWFCQSEIGGRRLRTDVDLNRGIISDALVKIKTSIITTDQGQRKVIVECGSCRTPFRNYIEIWINGRSNASVWLNANRTCMLGFDTPCEPNQCSCSPFGNMVKIAYDNLSTGTKLSCSVDFKDELRRGRYHVTANTIFYTGAVLSVCPETTVTLKATDDISTFISSGYRTGSSDNELSCSWLIDSGSPSENIIIFIIHSDVISPEVIGVYDGFTTSNNKLLTAPGLSGNGTIKTFITTGQYALLVFTTESLGQEQGFTMHFFRANDLSGTGCITEQTLTASSIDKFLTSPSFPKAYPGNANCRWLIQAQEGTVYVELFFSDIQDSPKCVSDYLKIIDVTYGEEMSHICSKYTGTTFNYTSRGTSVLVLFVSDADIEYKGFKLKYSSVPTTLAINPTTGPSSTEFDVVSSCPDSTTALTASDDISTLTSPRYGTTSDDISTLSSREYTTWLYDNDLSCSWLIDSGSPSANIIIYITYYDVTSPNVIVIHNGFSSSNLTLTSPPGLSGSGTNKDFMTTGQYALVVFTTDSPRHAKGFTMQYFRAKDLSGTGCNAKQTLIAISTDQYLTSPLFPRAYPGNLNCQWLIRAPEGAVKFELFFSDIQNSPNCVSDYLKIYEITNAGEETQIVTTCTMYSGTTINYTSYGASLLIVFVSDAEIGYKGFKLMYSSVATPIITTATTVPMSTGFFDIFLDKNYIPLGIGIFLILISFVCCLICVCKKCHCCHTTKMDNTVPVPTDQQTLRTIHNSEEQLSDYASIDENQMLSQTDLQQQQSANIRLDDNASYFSIRSSSSLPSSGSVKSNGYLDVIADPYESPVTSRYLNCDEEHKYCTTVKKEALHIYQNDAFVQ